MHEKKKKFTQLSRSERDEIYLLKKKGYSYEKIGDALGRAGSAIWNEVVRNQTKGVYVPRKATHKAYVRRRSAKYQAKKIVESTGLREYVDTRLLAGQSPEDISGRLRNGHEKGIPCVSKESIYRYVASVYGRKIEAKLKKKKRRTRKRKNKGTLDGRIFIDKRPLSINGRGRIGDAEFDFIVSGRDGTGILLVVVDRKIRVSFLEPIRDVNIALFHRAMQKIKKRYPEWRTGTTDNDLLLRRHQELGALLSIRVFFCHPYHSWEKGTVENTNGEIRKQFSKGSDVSHYSRAFFRKIEERLNARFMKCLDYRTPTEALLACRKQKKLRERRRKERNTGHSN